MRFHFRSAYTSGLRQDGSTQQLPITQTKSDMGFEETPPFSIQSAMGISLRLETMEAPTPNNYRCNRGWVRTGYRVRYLFTCCCQPC